MGQFTKATRERLRVAGKLKYNPETPFRLITDVSKMPGWMSRAFRNNRYTVMITDKCPTTNGYAIRAMIQAHDDRPIQNHWSEMQRIKNEIFGPETWAVEYYPSQSKLQDIHNIYWLWIYPGEVLPIPI